MCISKVRIYLSLFRTAAGDADYRHRQAKGGRRIMGLKSTERDEERERKDRKYQRLFKKERKAIWLYEGSLGSLIGSLV